MSERDAQGVKRAEFHLQHGWSFDAGCWQSWRDAAPAGWSFLVADRGYTRQPISFTAYNDREAIHVAVAHSFGLHLTHPGIYATSDLLVVINSFRQFDQRAARGIKRMSGKLDDQPETVLKDFRANCFGTTEAPPVPAKLDVALLQADLLALSEQEIDMKLLARIPSILILHGENDTVVRAEQARLLHELLPDSKLVMHAKAGHALPFTHRQWCLDQICRELAVAKRQAAAKP